MARRTVKLPAEFIKPVFKADRSVRLEFETGEMSGNDVAILSDMRQAIGWLLFSENDIEEAPEEQANPDLSTKSPSERLRNVLYVHWKQSKKEAYPSFSVYYDVAMERLIDTVKSWLDPKEDK